MQTYYTISRSLFWVSKQADTSVVLFVGSLNKLRNNESLKGLKKKKIE